MPRTLAETKHHIQSNKKIESVCSLQKRQPDNVSTDSKPSLPGRAQKIESHGHATTQELHPLRESRQLQGPQLPRTNPKT